MKRLQPSEIDLVVFHNPCPDGFTSATIVNIFLKSTTVEYIGMQYTSSPDELYVKAKNKNLLIKGTLGFDFQAGQGNSYLPKSTLYGQRENGRADRTLQNNKSWQYELTTNYTKVFGDVHNLSLLAFPPSPAFPV